MRDRLLDDLKEKLKDKFNILRVIMIAAMYIVVTVITAQFSFLDVQLRVTEALCILPVFTPVAVPALFIGCFFANLFAGAPWPDVVFGSLATLIGAYGTWKLRDMKPYIAIIPPIVVNLLVVPFILRFAYGVGTPIPMMMLTVGLGEIGACGVLGLLLYRVLLPYKEKLFGYVDEAEDRYGYRLNRERTGEYRRESSRGSGRGDARRGSRESSRESNRGSRRERADEYTRGSRREYTSEYRRESGRGDMRRDKRE